jgi:hypothetical protein
MSSYMMPSPASTSITSAHSTSAHSTTLSSNTLPREAGSASNRGCYFTGPHGQAKDILEDFSRVSLDEFDSDTSSEEWQPPTQALHAFVGLTTRAQFEALEAAVSSPGDAKMFPVDGLPEVWYNSLKGVYWRINDLHGHCIRRNGEIEYNVSWCEAQRSKKGHPIWKLLPGEYDTWMARGDLEGGRLVGLMNLTDMIIRERKDRERAEREKTERERKDYEKNDLEREDCERRELRREQEREEEATSPHSDWASTKRKWQRLGMCSTDIALKQINESTLMKRRATAAAAAATEASPVLSFDCTFLTSNGGVVKPS